jgi:hypothetical protein
MIVYKQLPLRLIFPSIFFIPWLLKPLTPYPHVAIVFYGLLVVCTEAWKVVTVRRAYKRQN